MTNFIIEKVSEHCKVTMAAMCSPSRINTIVKARHLVFYFVRKYTNISLAETGRLLYRDHATALHGYNSITNQIQSYWQFRKEIEPLELAIQNAVPTVEIESDEVFMENDYFNN